MKCAGKENVKEPACGNGPSNFVHPPLSQSCETSTIVRRGFGGNAVTAVREISWQARYPAAPPSFCRLRDQMFINIALATNNAVGPSRRGTINGLSMTLGSLAKAAGPTSTSVVFAWSISQQPRRPFPLDFHLVFYLLALAMAVVAVASWNIIVQDEDTQEGLAVPPATTRTKTCHRHRDGGQVGGERRVAKRGELSRPKRNGSAVLWSDAG